MLARCFKEDRGFVIVLLKDGAETDKTGSFYEIGTYVQVIDFQKLENGLLGITVEGVTKVSIIRSWQRSDGLYTGDVENLLDEAHSEVPQRFDELPSVLKALSKHPVVRDLNMKVNYEDARDIGWRLTELLPLDKHEKQRLVELQDPLERLNRLQVLLEALGGS